MEIKVGDTFRNASEGEDFAVKRVVKGMVVLESQDKKRQIFTEMNTLELGSFYLKKEIKKL